MSAIFGLLRLVAFGVLLVFTLIVFGISANLIHVATSGPFGGPAPAFAVYSLVVCIFTFLSVIPIFAIELMRKGAMTAFVAVELAWTAVLGLLWLAAGANDAAQVLGFVFSCDDGLDPAASSLCHQFQAIEAFSFLNWLILWGWTGLLLVCAIIAMTRGNKGVWMQPAGQTDFFARNQVPPVGHQPMMQPQYTGQPQGQYPPQPQYANQQQPQGGYPAGGQV